MSKKVKRAEDLDVFQKAHNFTLKIYKMTALFPQSEKFALISQMRRAAFSICANIMEGSHRHSTKEFRQFVGIANGSAGELKYYLLLAKDLGYLENKDYEIVLDFLHDLKNDGIIKNIGLLNNIKQLFNILLKIYQQVIFQLNLIKVF